MPSLSTNSSCGEHGLISEDFVAASHNYHHLHQLHQQQDDGHGSAATPPFGMGGGYPSSSSSSSSSSLSRGHIFGNLVAALKVDYSVLRQGNSKHLLYRILDEAVDYLLPIARAYRTRVRLFQAHLHRNESKFTKVSYYILHTLPPSLPPSLPPRCVDYLLLIARAYRTRVRLFQAHLHRNESKFTKVSSIETLPPSPPPRPQHPLDDHSSTPFLPASLHAMRNSRSFSLPPSLPPSPRNKCGWC